MTLSELVIKITADTSGAISGIEETEKRASKLSGVAGKVSSGLKTAGSVAAGALAVSAAAITGLVTSAVKAYAQYEQLVGGVETLFGESAEAVKKYAHEAFKTAGLDANKYMETVTSFSASLLQSLGGDTQRAAEVAHMAMVDMSDNANKMGTDMQAIMAAYQGFAKQNYTMLDNLKLGYGGTRKEMQRLLKDAEKLTGKKYNIDNLNDVYEAIHAIQEELGIAGTTAKEAETTIQGSFNQMKSAWENLKIAMADPNGNIEQALNDVISSAKTFGKNIVPVISTALSGIGTAIKEIAPVISAELPGLISDIMPNLVDGAVSLVSGLTTAIVDNAPLIIDGFGQVFQSAGEALKASDNPIFSAIGEVLTFIGDLIRDPEGTLTEAFSNVWETIKSTAERIWGAISEKASEIWESIKGWWTENISEPVSKVWNDVWGAITKAVDDISRSVGAVWQSVKSWWTENISQPVAAVWNDVWGEIVRISGDISRSASEAWEKIKGWWTENISGPAGEAWQAVKAAIEKAVKGARDTLTNVWSNIKSTAEASWDLLKTAASTVWETIKAAVENAVKGARDTLTNVWSNVKSTAEAAWNLIKSTAQSIWNGIKSFIENPIKTARDTLTNVWSNIKSTAVAAWNSFKAAVEPIVNSVKGVIDTVSSAVEGVIDWFKQLMGYDGKELSSTTSTHTHTNVIKTVEDVASAAREGLGGAPEPRKTLPELAQALGFARGDWNVPYDMAANLHRGEMVLTASQARRYRDGEGSGMDLSALANTIVSAVREGMAGASVNSFLDGQNVTDEISRIVGEAMAARRFA